MLGVGPGEFAEHYSTVYGNRVGLVEQRKNYRGHNLYLETLAETGAIGLMCLLSVLFVIMRGLWKTRSLLKTRHLDLANAAGAFFLSLSAYLISAIFAHLSYQRYFWLLVALSSAALRIVRSHSAERPADEFLRQSQA
jgi:O-antigen ligase